MKTKNIIRERNEQLREAVNRYRTSKDLPQLTADIRRIGERFPVPPKWPDTIVALAQGERPVRVRERSGLGANAIHFIAHAIGMADSGRYKSRVDERRTFEEAVAKNLGRSDAAIAKILSERFGPINPSKITRARLRIRSALPADRITIGTHPPTLSREMCRNIVMALLKDPRDSTLIIAKNLGTNIKTIERQAHHFGIPLDPSKPAFDPRLSFMAAQETVRQYFSNNPDEENVIGTSRENPFISRLESITGWPQSDDFRGLDRVLSYYLRKAGIGGAEDLEARIDKNQNPTLRIPRSIFNALHFALAGGFITFNHRRIRRISETKLWDPAPTRENLEISATDILRALELELESIRLLSEIAAAHNECFRSANGASERKSSPNIDIKALMPIREKLRRLQQTSKLPGGKERQKTLGRSILLDLSGLTYVAGNTRDERRAISD